MRVLLDECLPRRLKSLIPGHEVVTVPEAGWMGKGNGELLELATGRFDAFVTVDRNLAAQRGSLSRLGIVLLSSRSNRLDDLRALVPDLVEALGRLQGGEVIRLGLP